MTKIVAIRREDKNKWEKRVPLVPEDIAKLSKENIKILAQPSDIRIYKDSDYEAVGVELEENISHADLVIGVKEMPIKQFRKNGAYMFFSHTIKGQPYNMDMLKKLMELECTLIDYECIVDKNNRRLVFFGRHAGLAGMIDTFHALGLRLKSEGIPNVFEQIHMAYEYKNLDHAKAEITKVAKQIKENGLPKGLAPLVVGFAGYGNVSIGAQEIFNLFPYREITPEQLLSGEGNQESTNELIKVVFREEHTVEPKNPEKTYNQAEYFSHPELYKSKFTPFLEKISVLVNCIFWTNKSPRLLTIENAKSIYSKPDPKLKVIGDISCDIKGSIECTYLATQPDEPNFVFDIDKNDIQMGVIGKGPVIMAVDNLPCEISKASSNHFSKALTPFMADLMKFDPKANFSDTNFPEPIKEAVILWNGELTPKFKFMEEFLD